MLDDCEIFIHTVSDLELKYTEGSVYGLTKASGLLRHLFLDAHPSVHKINRTCKIKLQFETIDFTLKPPIRPTIQWFTLDTNDFANARKITVNLEKFLGAEILDYKGKYFSVRDVILAYAHAGGGVHSGLSDDEKHSDISELDKILKVMGLDAGLASLRGIMSVSIRALKPLVETIQKAA